MSKAESYFLQGIQKGNIITYNKEKVAHEVFIHYSKKFYEDILKSR